MKSNNQKIIVIDDKGKVKQLDSVVDLNTFINSENKARETLFMTPLNCENVQVFVGEKRCLKALPGRATTQFYLAGAGCDCGDSNEN